MSEAGYYRQEVRRNNFIQLFLDRYNADQYVATHLYGAINNMSVVDVPQEELDDLLGTSAEYLSNSFVGKVKHMNKSLEKVRKLSPGETYIALIKGYCALSPLLQPKAFVNGGYGISAIFMIISGVLSLIAVNMLVNVGLSTNLYSYPLAV